jgi:hypothetical protein
MTPAPMTVPGSPETRTTQMSRTARTAYTRRATHTGPSALTTPAAAIAGTRLLVHSPCPPRGTPVPPRHRTPAVTTVTAVVADGPPPRAVPGLHARRADRRPATAADHGAYGRAEQAEQAAHGQGKRR